jgi:asparagine synthase (glutamine-hydrolysing)
MSYPFLHRPLVEFLLAIPFEQKLRPGETRSLMRRALRDVLPQKILQRRSKGVTGETLCRGIAKEWRTLKLMLDNAHVVDKGYVNQKALIAAFDLARHGRELNIVALLETISLELWLRSLECHGIGVRTAPKSRDARTTKDSILHLSKQLSRTVL